MQHSFLSIRLFKHSLRIGQTVLWRSLPTELPDCDASFSSANTSPMNARRKLRSTNRMEKEDRDLKTHPKNHSAKGTSRCLWVIPSRPLVSPATMILEEQTRVKFSVHRKPCENRTCLLRKSQDSAHMGDIDKPQFALIYCGSVQSSVRCAFKY